MVIMESWTTFASVEPMPDTWATETSTYEKALDAQDTCQAPSRTISAFSDALSAYVVRHWSLPRMRSLWRRISG